MIVTMDLITNIGKCRIFSSRRLFVQKLYEINLACAKLEIAVFTWLTNGAVSRAK